MEKKKILMIGPSPTKSKGGMATVIQEILLDDKIKNKVDIDMHESYVDGNKIFRSIFSLYAFLKFCLTGKNYDIYHIHAASFGSTKRKLVYIKVIKHWNKKIIFHIHGGKYIEFFESLTANQQMNLITVLKSCNMVLALSNDWKNKFETIMGIDNCYVLTNGVNTDIFCEAMNDVSTTKDAFLVLGRMCRGKGTYDVLESMRIATQSNSNIHIYFAGDGEIDTVKGKVIEYGLKENVSVVGWADLKEKINLLKQVSTLVLASYNEGLPMSILEGMSCGKAVISTNVGAIPELIKKDNGKLIDPGDVASLAKLLILFSQNEKLLKMYSVNNIKVINEEYKMSVMHEKLLSYYNTM